MASEQCPCLGSRTSVPDHALVHSIQAGPLRASLGGKTQADRCVANRALSSCATSAILGWPASYCLEWGLIEPPSSSSRWSGPARSCLKGQSCADDGNISRPRHNVLPFMPSIFSNGFTIHGLCPLRSDQQTKSLVRAGLCLLDEAQELAFGCGRGFMRHLQASCSIGPRAVYAEDVR